jgi:cytoskeleton protein RodZ
VRELGQFLRTKRESLGLSLDEVQERTKIRKRYLIALENGDWSILPGNVYGRGFVRSYAEVLGLDGLELLQKYLDMPPEADAEDVQGNIHQQGRTAADYEPLLRKEQLRQANRDHKPVYKEDTDSQPPQITEQKKRASRTRERVPSPSTRLLSGKKFNTFSQAAVVVGVLAIIGGSLYVLNRDKGQTSPQTGNTVAAGLTQNASNATNASQSDGHQSNITGQANLGNQAAGNTANTTNSTSQNQAAGSASIIPAAFQNNVQSYTVVTTNPLSVSLTAASGDCWVKVTADNSIIDGSDMINQGMKKSWSAEGSLTIRVGNISAVQLEANGQPVTLPQTTNAVDITFVKQQPQTH